MGVRRKRGSPVATYEIEGRSTGKAKERKTWGNGMYAVVKGYRSRPFDSKYERRNKLTNISSRQSSILRNCVVRVDLLVLVRVEADRRRNWRMGSELG